MTMLASLILLHEECWKSWFVLLVLLSTLTPGEVLRVDTAEAQSLSNWIDIVDGRDRRGACASHPTSTHYVGDKLTSSGLVKTMCVDALCQAVPCGIRDCKESLISVTWSDVRMALLNLDHDWQQALHGLKELSTHTSDFVLKGKVVTEAVPANREKSNDHHVTDPFAFSARSMPPRCGPLCRSRYTHCTSTINRCPVRATEGKIQGFHTIYWQVNMFRKAVLAVPARRHTSYWLRLQVLPSSHIASNPFQNACVEMLDTDFSGAAWCQRCIKGWKGQNCATMQSTLT